MSEGFQVTHISIDLVPSTPVTRRVTLPHHNFLPVPRKQRPDSEVSRSGPSSQTRHGPTSSKQDSVSMRASLYTDVMDQTVFSQVENGLIKALPRHIVEGYRLSKAMRNNLIMQPIVPELIHLGVTQDIHNVIRTYHLKSCVFYLTENYVYTDEDAKKNNRLQWAIYIFAKLREFILLGNIMEFFDTENNRYMFKQLPFAEHDVKVECQHDGSDFNVALPRFYCCRVRKARLLMVDQILRVLRDTK